MGQPKLLLPWRGQTVIENVLDAWNESRVDEVIVVARRDDESLQSLCRKKTCHLVLPRRDPSDMRSSVEFGLRFVEQTFRPGEEDAWLLAPADMPTLSVSVIDQLLAAFSGQIMIPRCRGKRGHPVLLPWSVASDVFQLPADEGINRLTRGEVEFVETTDAASFADLDTPADYGRLHDSGDD